MALKAVNFKLEDDQIDELRRLAALFNMSMTDIVRKALDSYISEAKEDPYVRLTSSVDNADPDETEEILDAIKDLSEDDLAISSRKIIVLNNDGEDGQ